MSEEKYSVKETKEAMIAIYMVGLFVVERAKDGIDTADALALAMKFADESFRSTVINGVVGAELIPAEVKDISFPEFIELSKVVGDLLSLHKKPEAA